MKETVIFEAELVALICAMRLWKHRLQGQPVLFFVDNNSARDVAISGAARSPVANRLLDLLLSDESSCEILAWYQRVPSPSNVADLPSRQLMLELELFGTRVRCEDVSSLLLRFNAALVLDGLDNDSVK